MGPPSLLSGSCKGLVASVWRLGEHQGGYGGTYGPNIQFYVGRSLTERPQFVVGYSHLPVANRAGPLTKDRAIVFPKASGVLKHK